NRPATAATGCLVAQYVRKPAKAWLSPGFIWPPPRCCGMDPGFRRDDDERPRQTLRKMAGRRNRRQDRRTVTEKPDGDHPDGDHAGMQADRWRWRGALEPSMS